MSALNLTLLLSGLLLIAALAAYAWHLWRRVWANQRARDEAQQERQQRIGGDLNILASSLLDEQLPLIEGAIRIKVLLDNYDSALSNDSRCQVFHLLFEATAEVPTHAGWKALDKAERRRFEKRFNELELQHKAAARIAARWLLDEGLKGSRANARAPLARLRQPYYLGAFVADHCATGLDRPHTKELRHARAGPPDSCRLTD